MKNELTIQHLAPYLPYGLKGRYMVGDVLKHLSASQNIERDKILAIDSVDFFYNFCKPILRPLSDLTKEIEHNGEKFVPNYNSDFKYFTPYELSYFIESIPHGLNYNQMQKLLEWHFDIFGLIDNGLAIDINTIK